MKVIRVLGLAAFGTGLLMAPVRVAAQSGTVTDDGFISTNATTQQFNLNGQGISLIVAGSRTPLLARDWH